MKITVLDGYTLNPGDLSWDALAALGDLRIYDRTSTAELAARCADATALITNKVPIDGDLLRMLPDLRYIGVTATGHNSVDSVAAKAAGIVVTNVPGYSTPSVVQLTFALILEHCLRVQRHSDSVANGEWAASEDFSYHTSPLIELAGKTIGIVGFGTIGRAVADVATAFGMQVLAHSRTKTDQSHRKNFTWAELDLLFSTSDFVSIHCPLTPETAGLVHAARIGKMKTSAFLINTSRGQLVNEADLAQALNAGVIAGAGLDVLCQEPPMPDNPLVHAKNCLVTPHIAWASRESRQRLMDAVVGNVGAFLNGAPVNVVNP